MSPQADKLSPEKLETIHRLKNAYMRDEDLPEDLAKTRASAEINRREGKTDDALDAGSGTLSSGEDG